MILDLLFGVLNAVISPLLALLPSVNLAEYLPHPGEIGAVVAKMDRYFALSTPIAFVAQLLEWGMLFVPLAIFVYIWRLLPGKAS